jgi:glycosyltransferase involved in cell wall biosynthesis
MGSVPEIAVIVGAYGRTTYVREAVRSVLEQTLPRERWELLVTKNFHDPAVDEALARDGVESRYDETPRIGTWLLRAIRATRAPLLTLLDDDDLYAPDRLAHVVDVFRDHPEVGFYRNRVEMVDARGGPAPREEWHPRGIDAYFDDHGPLVVGPADKGELVDLLFHRTRVSFNSSTMAFRREVLDGRRAEHFAATRLPDSSLLLNAVLAPYGLYLDDRRLTRHRLHPGNVTRGTHWLSWAAESYRAFGVEAREFHRPDLAAYYDGVGVHYERMFRSGELVDLMAGGAARRHVAELAADYARFLGRHPAERALSVGVWAPEAYAAAYLVSPWLARRVQRSRVERPKPAGPAAAT